MAKEQLAVTIWNYKGGVGKSTIAHIITQIGIQRGMKVLAVDLDEQRNLTKTLELSSSLYPSIEVRNALPEGDVEEDIDMYVIDTHPSKDKIVERALKFADIVLLPILGDYHSLINLVSAFDYIRKAGAGTQQAAIVKNGMSGLKVTAEVEEALEEMNYPIAGRLPHCNTLLRNLASGYSWDKYLRVNQHAQFLKLYENLWTAYREMLKGNFSDLWKK